MRIQNISWKDHPAKLLNLRRNVGGLSSSMFLCYLATTAVFEGARMRETTHQQWQEISLNKTDHFLMSPRSLPPHSQSADAVPCVAVYRAILSDH